MLVATLATVAVHVAHVTVAVHASCVGIAGGISITPVTGSRMVVLVGLDTAMAVSHVIGMPAWTLVLLDREMEDSTSVDSDTNVTNNSPKLINRIITLFIQALYS